MLFNTPMERLLLAVERILPLYRIEAELDRSDARVKSGMESIQDPMGKVEDIGAYRYRRDDRDGEAEFGVLAQEVEEVLPETVGRDRKGYRTVDYRQLTPVLLQAVKQQQQQIRSLKEETEELRRSLGERA